MLTRRRWIPGAFATVVLLAAVAALAAATTTPATPATKGTTPAGFTARDSARTGDLIMHRNGGLSVAVPEHGSVGGTLDYVDGRSRTLEVIVDAAGRVLVRDSSSWGSTPGMAHDELGPGARTSGGCGDKSYVPLFGRWKKTVKVFTSSKSRPSYIGQQAFRDSVLFSLASITTTRNTCGRGDVVGIKSSDGGNTTKAPNLPSGGTYGSSCAATGDGMSVVGFGGFGGANGVLALNCRWTDSADAIIETDTKLNNGYKWTGNPKSCPKGYYVIRGILTHEWGHGFGLAHPSDVSDHPQLSMTRTANTCSDKQSWLGNGDINGLASKY